jgi:hypothetical protein
VLDIGCGTGAAGAAWATGGNPAARISGIDRNRWAVDEARWTYRALGIPGSARIGDLRRLPTLGPRDGVLAAYVLNELPDAPAPAARGAVARCRRTRRSGAGRRADRAHGHTLVGGHGAPIRERGRTGGRMAIRADAATADREVRSGGGASPRRIEVPHDAVNTTRR